MRKLICSLGVCFLLTITVGVQAQDFEGVVYYEVEEMKAAGMGEMAYMIKDNKARMEYGEGMQQGAVLFLPEKEQMVILISQMKGYMLMDTNEMEGMEEEDEEKAIETGETKTVAGHECEIWQISSEEETYEVCVASGMGNFVMPNPRQGTPEWARQLANEGFMPLEVVTIQNGERKVNMRATRIEQKQLDASLFTIPDGYKDMSNMMNRFQQGN